MLYSRNIMDAAYSPALTFAFCVMLESVAHCFDPQQTLDLKGSGPASEASQDHGRC